MKLLMRLMTFSAALLAAATFFSCTETAQTAFSDEHILWYDEPAEIWEETLPLGNGRLGMMPDGGIGTERIILNEISMWSGCEMDYANPDAAESLNDIRALLLEGKNAEAQEVMYKRFVPHKPTDGGTYGSYQTLGDLWIDYNGLPETAEKYSRGLDLRTATAFTEIVNGPARHNRKYYVSKDCDAIIIEIEGNPVEFDVRMT
ncbi:MAG: glycoside hydrolase family 95 protein, partial [Bacteroidales bacterium]|nr:glycoside hydrolase family 95 protein [Bacteroidales bacterium]